VTGLTGSTLSERSDHRADDVRVALHPIDVELPGDANSRYSVDWSGDAQGQMLAVARPRSVDEVRAVVAYCADKGIAVIPQGGHTGLTSGAISPKPGCLIVSLERLNAIRDIDDGNFSITVEAGCLLQNVKDAADERDFLFPLSLGAQGSCQIGGNVATNAGGVNVLRYGMMRNLVLGLEVVLPDGSLWNGLGGLRKDNRGYDLKQLFIGSEGTLGIVTAACLKLQPRPEVTETAYLGLDTFADAIDLFSRARRSCADLMSGFEIIGTECIPLATEIYPQLQSPLASDAPVHVLMEVSASRLVPLRAMMEVFLTEAMEADLVRDAVLASSIAQAQSFWRIREGLVEGHGRRGYHVRSDISVRLPQIAPLIEQLRAMLEGEFAGWTSQSYGHAGDGNVHFNALPPAGLSLPEARAIGAQIEGRIFQIVEALDGSISAEHGLGRTKRDRFASSVEATHLTMMRTVKRAFDPANIMNPGCILAEDEVAA
tara:strand:- start:4578 stop:6035 length:1458 start_codon:yes stop_codon:yes gene_type:complete